MALSLMEVLADPARAGARLERDGDVYGVRVARARSTRSGAAILDLTLDPLPAFLDEEFPAETVKIVVFGEDRVGVPTRALAYVTSGADRTFQHRNPSPSRSLCLFFDGDDPALRWLPEDGLEAYVNIVRRHLIFEEYFRREGVWPVEDAPHGRPGPDGYPILTKQMHVFRRQWRRRAA